MKRKLLPLFVFTLLFSQQSFCNNYSALLIPPELKEGADAVVRMDQTTLEVHSPKLATMHQKYAITILNSNGDKFAHFVKGYDKARKITAIKGTIYDAFGKEIRKIKKKEILDQSAVSDISLYEDDRIKAIEVIQNTYPFTVEFEYSMNFNNLLDYPDWDLLPHYKVSLERSQFELTIPNNLEFRKKEKNISVTPKIKKVGNKTTYKWSAENIPALKSKPYGPPIQEVFPAIYFAPNKFEYGGYKGNMKTWESYGAWLYELGKDRTDLPKEAVTKIKKLVAGVDTPKEKAKIIYEYMQSKTRYISIQLGIGGLQPFPAEMVEETGYGDCKALSNYMRAMLKVVEIPAYNVAIGAGRGNSYFEDDFSPESGFNHMILCIPLEQDTIWLECTSQNQPFGYIGTFTDDRKALLITEEGGKIARTTTYDQAVNTQIRKAHIKVDQLGNATAAIETKYAGLQYENVKYQLTSSAKEAKENLYESLDIPNVEITEFNYLEKKDLIPEVTEELQLNIRKYGSVSGKRIFIPLNILNKFEKSPPKIKDRKTDFILNLAYIDEDEITYEIPGYFKIEHLPDPIKIDSEFGTYEATTQVDGNKITYRRVIKRNNGRFAPERYDDFIDFYKKIIKADKIKMVVLEVERP